MTKSSRGERGGYASSATRSSAPATDAETSSYRFFWQWVRTTGKRRMATTSGRSRRRLWRFRRKKLWASPLIL